MKTIRYHAVRFLAGLLRVPVEVHPTFWMSGIKDFNTVRSETEPK